MRLDSETHPSLLLRRTDAGRGRTRRRAHPRLSLLFASGRAAAGPRRGTRSAADDGRAHASGRLPQRPPGGDSGRRPPRRVSLQGAVASLSRRHGVHLEARVGHVAERVGPPAPAGRSPGPDRHRILRRPPDQHHRPRRNRRPPQFRDLADRGRVFHRPLGAAG